MEEIKLENIDPKFSIETVNEAIEILNGIYCFIKRYGWKEGYRNDMAVDASIAGYILNVDIDQLLEPVMTSDDMKEMQERTNVIEDYLHGWSISKHIPMLSYCQQAIFWETRVKSDQDRIVCLAK